MASCSQPATTQHIHRSGAPEDVERNEALSRLGADADARGVVCKPAKGDAIVWYNYDADGRLDPRAVHSALPVLRGQKWAANHWISLTPHELLLQVAGGGLQVAGCKYAMAGCRWQAAGGLCKAAGARW